MRFGPCLCGDTHCASCGPAQGNYKCMNCGKWTDDGGCDDPKACEEAVLRIEAAMARLDGEILDE